MKPCSPTNHPGKAPYSNHCIADNDIHPVQETNVDSINAICILEPKNDQ